MSSGVPENLGSGAYGFVIRPALFNVNEKGNRIEFPNNITKIMNSRTGKQELITARRIVDKTPMKIPMYRYRRNVTMNNIPESARRFIAKKMKAKGVANSDIDRVKLFPLRMPYLGTSFSDIVKKPETRRRFLQLPFNVIFSEMVRLMKVVKSVKDAGYIHGDIRETNILCNLDTGAMTIIDFDWLMSAEEYLRKYPRFFYSQPPEIYILKNAITELESIVFKKLPENTDISNTYIENELNQLEKNIKNGTVKNENATLTEKRNNNIITTTNDLLYVDYKLTLPELASMVAIGTGIRLDMLIPETYHGREAGLTKFLETVINDSLVLENPTEGLLSLFLENNTIDSYGLALTFMFLFSNLYNEMPPNIRALYDAPIKEILFYNGMMNPNMFERMTIEEAISKLESIQKTSPTTTSGGGRKKHRTLHRCKISLKHRRRSTNKHLAKST